VAVAVQLDFQNATLEQYDEANERIGLLPGGPAPGSRELFHWVMETEDGFRVVDVWESREAFEAFEQGKLRSIYREVGIVDPPKIQFFDVHNYLAGGRWRG
jgi:heme-degrading monooxygenase HmoA